MANKESFFGDVRKHLMTGVSYMIPFVVPGGILIAVAFAMGGIYVFNTPGFAADMFGWGKVAFGLMVPALAGFIAGDGFHCLPLDQRCQRPFGGNRAPRERLGCYVPRLW
jgi:hypothetical protein